MEFQARKRAIFRECENTEPSRIAAPYLKRNVASRYFVVANLSFDDASPSMFTGRLAAIAQ